MRTTLFQAGGPVVKRINKLLREVYPDRTFDVSYSNSKSEKIIWINGDGESPANWESWMLGLKQSQFDGSIKTTWGDFPA